MQTKSTRLITAYFLAELIGTFLLVLIGDGTIAAYVLTRREVDLFIPCFAFGIGAMIATFATARISGAHINPAATVAFALDGRIKWRLVPVYLCAQYLGGFLAALTLFANNAEAINSFDGGERSAFGSRNSTGHIFATYPGAWVSVWGTLLDQILGTAVLLFSVCAIQDKANAGLEERHQPFIVALIIGMVCVAFNPNCGAIFNPARDLAPRLLTSLFGYSQPSVWSPVQGLYWLTAGLIGPHVGAVVGVFAYKLIISASLAHKIQFELESMNEQQITTSKPPPSSTSPAAAETAASYQQQLESGGQLPMLDACKFILHSPVAAAGHHHQRQPIATKETNYGTSMR